MSGAFNLLDAGGPGRWLEEIAAAQGAGHDDAFIVQLAAHLRTALEKPLKKHEAAMRVVEHLPPRAPPGWPDEKWQAVLDDAAAGRAPPFHQFDPASDPSLRDRVAHVADFIAAAMVNDAGWLKETDERGRPKKLLKLGSLAQAETLADQALRRAFNRAAHDHQAFEAELASGDIEVVMDLPDGSRWVRLRTPAALDAESARMGHCIGAGSYDARLASGNFRYYSLRDAKNEPHATLEVEQTENRLLQCQGKENKAPVARYVPAIRDFVQGERLSLEDVHASRTGLIEQDGQYYDIYNLPAGLTIDGDLELSGLGITALPASLSVGGSLDLRDTGITALPEDLQVGGLLDLSRTAITALPEDLTLGGSLYLSGTRIAALPAGLRVGRYLDLSNTAITMLPEGLRVGAGLYLSGTGITVLPEGLRVGGSLALFDTKITALPEGLKVGGWLDLRGTPIAALPEGLAVAGDLDLRDTGITTLPEDLTVGGRIYTDRGILDSVADARRAFAAPHSARASQGPAP